MGVTSISAAQVLSLRSMRSEHLATYLPSFMHQAIVYSWTTANSVFSSTGLNYESVPGHRDIITWYLFVVSVVHFAPSIAKAKHELDVREALTFTTGCRGRGLNLELYGFWATALPMAKSFLYRLNSSNTTPCAT